jgi:putative Mg2+ transporter-C (MgtC) family protein
MGDLISNPQVKILAYVALSMLFGGLIGIDREIAGKPAGLRTHMLVAGAATLLVGLGDSIVQAALSQLAMETVRSDPIRIVEAVITGVSFLGAGTIIRDQSKGQVEGLTTAGSILLAAAVGVSVALEQILLAGGVTLLILITLQLLGRISKLIEGTGG